MDGGVRRGDGGGGGAGPGAGDGGTQAGVADATGLCSERPRNLLPSATKTHGTRIITLEARPEARLRQRGSRGERAKQPEAAPEARWEAKNRNVHNVHNTAYPQRRQLPLLDHRPRARHRQLLLAVFGEGIRHHPGHCDLCLVSLFEVVGTHVHEIFGSQACKGRRRTPPLPKGVSPLQRCQADPVQLRAWCLYPHERGGWPLRGLHAASTNGSLSGSHPWAAGAPTSGRCGPSVHGRRRRIARSERRTPADTAPRSGALGCAAGWQRQHLSDHWRPRSSTLGSASRAVPASPHTPPVGTPEPEEREKHTNVLQKHVRKQRTGTRITRITQQTPLEAWSEARKTQRMGRE